MAKTDKELTIEAVNNFISSWNASNNTQAINSSQLIEIIKAVHKTIQDLPETKEK